MDSQRPGVQGDSEARLLSDNRRFPYYVAEVFVKQIFIKFAILLATTTHFITNFFRLHFPDSRTTAGRVCWVCSERMFFQEEPPRLALGALDCLQFQTCSHGRYRFLDRLFISEDQDGAGPVFGDQW
jgi:hypothetical protein